MIKDAKDLQEFISSVRRKAFEDVINLINSDAVTKGDYNQLMIDAKDLSELINSIDSAKLKKARASLKDEGEVTFEVRFGEPS